MLYFPSRHVEICRVSIPIENLPQHLKGLRIVQLSDFHYGDRSLPPKVLKEAIAIAQNLKPDLVCYTGDFINGDPETIEDLCQKLYPIKSRFGSIAVLGNHDSKTPESPELVTQTLEKYDIQVLNDVVKYPCGPELAFAGFSCPPDFTPQNFEPQKVMEQIPEHLPRIVLAHGPRYEESLRPWSVDLQLSGHTHGGQLSFPGLGPLIPRFWQVFHALPQSIQKRLIPRLPRRIVANKHCIYFHGLYALKHSKLYVNRGLGAHFPGRLFCPPEVTQITLVPAHQLSADASRSGDLAEMIT